MESDVYVDDNVVVSYSFSEYGWFLQRFQGWLRYLKFKVYPNHKFLLFTFPDRHVFVDDFINYTIDFPDWFYGLKLDQDCYEAVVPGSPPGSLTPPDIFASLLKHYRTFYNREKAIEAFPPRGFSLWVDSQPQIFARYVSKEPIDTGGVPLITVFPRSRVRASNRNVPEYIWRGVVEDLSKDFVVCLAGTPSGACLEDMTGNNIINLINYNEEDKSEKVIQHLNSSILSVSSQSGGTHISLLSGCNTYVIGHEKDRHTIHENRHNVPSSFRYISDYRAVDVDTITGDIAQFLEALKGANLLTPVIHQVLNKKPDRPSLQTLKDKKNIVGVEIGVDDGLNALNILETLDIKTLYLVDPYDGQMHPVIGHEDRYLSAVNRLSKHSDKIIWVKQTSTSAAPRIPDNLDFVYIDGMHTYNYVKSDIHNYYNKVKSGGLVAGHDYNIDDIKTAVSEFFSKETVYTATCKEGEVAIDWWVIKEECNNAESNNISCSEFDIITKSSMQTFSELVEEQRNG